MRGSFIILRRFTFARAGFVWSSSIFTTTTRLDAAAAAAHPPSVVLPLYDVVVGALIELHYYFNISKNQNDQKQLFYFTTSKLVLYHLCSSRFDCFRGLYRHVSWFESVRFLGIIPDTPFILIRGRRVEGPLLLSPHSAVLSSMYVYIVISTAA